MSDTRQQTSEAEIRETGSRPAGEDVSDEAFVRTVERQTSSDRAAQALFEREREGVLTDTEAAKAFTRERPD